MTSQTLRKRGEEFAAIAEAFRNPLEKSIKKIYTNFSSMTLEAAEALEKLEQENQQLKEHT